MTEEQKVEAKLVEVPSQYVPAFQLEDGSIIDERELLIRIYNKISKIEKSVA